MDKLNGKLRIGQIVQTSDQKHIYVGWYDGSTRDLASRTLENLVKDLNDVEYMVELMGRLRDQVKRMVAAKRSLGETLPGEKPAQAQQPPKADGLSAEQYPEVREAVSELATGAEG